MQKFKFLKIDNKSFDLYEAYYFPLPSLPRFVVIETDLDYINIFKNMEKQGIEIKKITIINADNRILRESEHRKYCVEVNNLEGTFCPI